MGFGPAFSVQQSINGINTDINKAIIEITTKSSISVNPFCLCIKALLRCRKESGAAH